VPLTQGRAIKLTTSTYFTASGRPVNGRGIEPDVVVRAENPRTQYSGPGDAVDPNTDKQLQEALRILDRRSVVLSRAP
jgi:carboxyl-terminal processing protease